MWECPPFPPLAPLCLGQGGGRSQVLSFPTATSTHQESTSWCAWQRRVLMETESSWGHWSASSFPCPPLSSSHQNTQQLCTWAHPSRLLPCQKEELGEIVHFVQCTFGVYFDCEKILWMLHLSAYQVICLLASVIGLDFFISTFRAWAIGICGDKRNSEWVKQQQAQTCASKT